MKITIDIREKDLWSEIVPLCNDLELKADIKVELLHLGDVIISDDDGIELFIIIQVIKNMH